jgi:hypothetical protein
MPKSVDEWLEPLLYVAQIAFESRSAREWDYNARFDYETGSNAAQWR